MKTFRKILDATSVVMLAMAIQTDSAVAAVLAAMIAALALGIGIARSKGQKWQ